MHPQRRRKKRPNYGTRTVEVSRGLNGFGFTISGQQPCIMSCIVPNSPADNAGLRAGDFLISVNNLNVSKMPHDSVVQLIGNSNGAIILAIAENYFSDSSDDEIRAAYNLRSRPKHLQGQKYKHKFKHLHGITKGHDSCASQTNLNKAANKITRKNGFSHDKNHAASGSSGYVINMGSNTFNEIKAKKSCEILGDQTQNLEPKQGCDANLAIPSTSALNISHIPLHNQTNKLELSKLINPVDNTERSVEYHAVIGYLGTIEMPKQIATSSKLQTVRSCIRKLRQEKRSPTIVLMTVLPSCLSLRNSSGNLLAEYPAKRINYVSCSSENDYRFFGLVTSATYPIEEVDSNEPKSADGDVEISNSCHVFMIDTKLVKHENHMHKAGSFRLKCTVDPIANMCLEFPNSSEYIVNIIRIMFSLKSPNGYSGRENAENISKLSNMNYRSPKGDKNFIRNAAVRLQNDARVRPVNLNGERHQNGNLGANSPQPSNHSEITTTSSNSDSGIGFHNDTQIDPNRIVVVDFSNMHNNFNYQRPNLYRPLGIAGPVVPNFEMDDSYLSNTTPVVEGFEGLGRPLNNLDIVDRQNIFCDLRKNRDKQRLHCRASNMPDVCSSHNYANQPAASSKSYDTEEYHQCVESPLYDQVYTESEDHHYEMIKPNYVQDWIASKTEDEYVSLKRVSCSECSEKNQKDSLHTGSFEITSFHSSKSQDFSKQSTDDLSIYSTKSHDPTVPNSITNRKIQTSIDDILILGLQNNKSNKKSDENPFLHPGNVIKSKLRKSLKPSSFLSKTKQMLQGKDDKARETKSKEKESMMNYKLSPKVFGVARPSVSFEDVCNTADDAKKVLLYSGSVDDCIGKVEWVESGHLEATCSEPDLRANSRASLDGDRMSEHSSPFRRWAAGGGAAADRALTHRSYRRPQSLATSSSEKDMYTKVEEEAKQAAAASSGSRECGSVAAWSLGLERLLADSRGTHAFCVFLAREFAAENIRFWTACERYARSGGGTLAAEEIWKRHLSDGASDPVNVDAAARKTAKERLEEAPADLFLQAQKQIFNLMKFDSYPRFLRSSIHADCARAELRGASPPYPGSLELEIEPHKVAATQHALSPSHSKLKKSLSNAEERRRGSLLPWARGRLRVASRDRTPSNTSSIVSNFSNNHPALMTESNGTGQTNQRCSLCRVMLPDAATTVVALDDTQTIRQLIDKLLDKRAIVCRAYDVFEAGSTKALDTNASAWSLGGREVCVERRVVFRVELPNRRCVSVRCRPTKPLRDVLRPVLQRYGASALSSTALSTNALSAPAAAATAVLSVVLAGTNVDLNSPVQIADGQRLQVSLNDNFLQAQLSQVSHCNKSCKDKSSSSDVTQNGVNLVNGIPTLDEITNRVFEELLQGKTENQSSKSDHGSIKSETCESEQSSNIFGQVLKRDESARGRNPIAVCMAGHLLEKRQAIHADGGSTSCLEDGACSGVRKPLIAKLRAGVKVQNAVNTPTENSEYSQMRLKEKFLNGDFQDGKITTPLQTSCSYDSALKCQQSSTPPIPAARNLSNISTKPCPAVRTTISQTRSSLPHATSAQTYPNEFFKNPTASDEENGACRLNGHKSYFNGSYSLPKSGFNSLENTVIENHFEGETAEVSPCDQKHPRISDPPPLPPKPKVLPTKPSNWGQTLSDNSLLDNKMQEINLPTLNKKIPYLDQAASSFV